jgi:ABC-2 type transport system permease protein
MKLYRIRAIVLRNIKITFRGLDPLVDFFYWPLFDIVLWGFTSRWVQAQTATEPFTVLLGALVLWQASYRSNLDISFGLLSEFWSRTTVSLFSTPLTLTEWMVSSMIVGLFNTVIAVLFGCLAVWLLYGISVFSLGLILIPFFLSLILSGWAIGFFTASALIYWGQSVQKLVWVMGWFFVPFSAVFYPVDTLPTAAKTFAHLLPMTYIFEGLRSYVKTGSVPYLFLCISFALNAFYLLLAWVSFNYMFNKSKIKGLALLSQN